MKAFSRDLRERVVDFVRAGNSKAEAARHFRVSYGFVKKLFSRLKTHGTLEPGHPPGPEPKLTPRQQEQLVDWVRVQPDATLAELCDRIRRECGVEFSISGLFGCLRRLGLSYKKSPARPPNRIEKTLPLSGGSGGPTSRGWIPDDWSSSTKLASAPT